MLLDPEDRSFPFDSGSRLPAVYWPQSIARCLLAAAYRPHAAGQPAGFWAIPRNRRSSPQQPMVQKDGRGKQRHRRSLMR